MCKMKQYSRLTGYTYAFSEHAKLRIWERFETLDNDREFNLFYRLMTSSVVDDNIICNLEIGQEAVIKNCCNNKVYVVVLTDNFTILLKTVYRDARYRRFVPYDDNNDSNIYRVYRDGTLRIWKSHNNC